MLTLALVDDDVPIVTSLKLFFQAEGYRIITFHDGLTALAAMIDNPPDLAILDVKMPRMDGMELLRRLRQSSDVPVIFLTSKDEEIDEMLGFNEGADDFVRKPCSNKLLAERVKAVLRRTRTPEDTDGNTIMRGRLVLEPDRHFCSWDGEPVRLTVTEFLILQALVQRPGHVKSRSDLITAAYNDDVYVDDRTIDSHIKRLRKKFRRRDETFDAIETLYGIGYRYNMG